MISDRAGCGKCFFACVVLSLSRGCTGIFTQRPQNAVSDVKGSVIFNCTTTAIAVNAWRFNRNGSQNPGDFETITDEQCTVTSNYKNNYNSEPTGSGSGTKICNLIIFDIHEDLGGAYTCVDTTFATSVALLTVVNSTSQKIDVNSATNCLMADTANVSCSIDYSGPISPAPVMPPSLNITSNSKNVIFIDPPYNDLSSNRVTKTVAFKVSSPDPVGPFQCTAYFDPPQNPIQPPYVGNAPTATYNESLPAIPVFKPVSNVTISGENCSNGGCYCEDGISRTLECQAEGCPPPKLSWSFNDGINCMMEVEGGMLNATFNGTFQCKATDSDASSSYVDIKVSGCAGEKICESDERPPGGDDKTIAIIIGVVVGFVVLCILIFVIFLIFYGSSKQHKAQLNETCPRLQDMLPTMNEKGCSCWVLLTVFIALLGAIIFVPALLIATYCCGKEKKSQGKKKKKTEESGMESPTNNSHNNSPPTNRQQGDPCQLELQSQDSYHPSRQPTPLGKGTPVNADGIQYSELPLSVDQRPGSRKPIQFINTNGQEGAYADLWST